jgi:flagellar hook-associated protein FlgK
MNTISTALSGLNAASLRLDTAAHNIANTLTPNFRRQTVVQQALPGGGVAASVERAAEPGGSLADDLIGQMSASYAYKANLKVVQTQDEIMGSLLDLKA